MANFQEVLSGKISPLAWYQMTGQRVRIENKAYSSKYTGADLRKIRQKNGVGNPKRMGK